MNNCKVVCSCISFWQN